MDFENKITNNVIELVKNIPATDNNDDILNSDMEQPMFSDGWWEYDIIAETSSYKLVKVVNEKLKQWWDTSWGVAVVNTGSGIKFYQTIERWVWKDVVNNLAKSEMPIENSEGRAMSDNAPITSTSLDDNINEDVIEW